MYGAQSYAPGLSMPFLANNNRACSGIIVMSYRSGLLFGHCHVNHSSRMEFVRKSKCTMDSLLNAQTANVFNVEFQLDIPLMPYNPLVQLECYETRE